MTYFEYMWKNENSKMKIYQCLYTFTGFVTVFAVWMGDKKWYYPANSQYQYHLTCEDTNYTSCQTKCKQLGNDVEFANFTSGLKHFGLINSIVIWTITKIGCSFNLNIDTLISPNCSHQFRCLCRQWVGNTMHRPNKISDKQGDGCQSRNVSNQYSVSRNNSRNNIEYIVTNNKTSYKNCINMCSNHGALIAKLNISVLSEKPLKQVKKMKGWLLKEGETNDSACHFAYKSYILTHNNCSRRLSCLCHRNLTSAHTTPGGNNINAATNSNTVPFWVSVNDRQFLVSNVNLSYMKAVEYCKKMEAALVSFTNPVQYILMSRTTQLSQFKRLFWVGDGIIPADDKCLVLNSTGITSLYSANCKTELYSICSRVANVSNVLNSPAFVKLIHNMTMNRHKTARMERKLNCAHDNRTSAKAIGALIGTAILAAVGSLLVLNDIIIVYQKFFRCE